MPVLNPWEPAEYEIMKTVRVGILGLAHGHVNAYCKRWHDNPALGIDVVAGWDTDPARAAAAAQTHGLRVAPQVNDILNDDAIDAVVIAAETVYHAGLVEQAAAAGKTVVLQKPLALTLEDADRIVAAIECTDVPFTMAWQMRVDPHNLQMRELLKGGRFGKIYQLRRRHCLSTQQWPGFDQSWHVQPNLNRDIFADDAAHAMDFVYWLMGMPVSVSAEMGTLCNPQIVNDHAIAVFRYEDDRFAEVSCSFAATAGENTTEIFCEKGAIIGNYGDQVSCNVAWPPGSIQLKWFVQGDTGWTISDLPDIRAQADRIAGLAEPLAAFLHRRRPALASAAEGRSVLRMTLACYHAAESGQRINL